MRCHYKVAATALLLAAIILHCADHVNGQGRPVRSPLRPGTPRPPPPPPFPAAQQIRLTTGTNQCVDIAGGAVVNNAKLVQARCLSSSQTQKFIVLNAGDGVLRIMSAVNTGKCWYTWPAYDSAPPSDEVAADYDQSAFAGAMRMWDCDFADYGNQFKPVGRPTGWSLIPAFSTSKCVTMNTTATETLLALTPCNATAAAQTFLFGGLLPPAAAPPPVAASPPPVVKSPPPLARSPPPAKASPPPKRAGKSPPSAKPPPRLATPSPPPRSRSPRLGRLA